jgi:hypothetical protein
MHLEGTPSSGPPETPPAPADLERLESKADEEPLHREKALADVPSDDRLSAWRKDHTIDRDQKAHERLRTVLEHRLFEPAWAEGRRLRAEREAMRAASPASASAPPYAAECPPPDAVFDSASAHRPAPLAAE